MKSLVPWFCQLALANAASLPPRERADLYECAAEMLLRYEYIDKAAAANTAAQDLRDAEASQSHFEALLSAAVDMNKVR
jgi:hypothetical protein